MKENRYKGENLKFDWEQSSLLDWFHTKAKDILWQYEMGIEEETTKILDREIRKLRKIPTVTDRMKPISISLDKKKTK